MRRRSVRRKSSQRFPLLAPSTNFRSFRWSAARIMIHFLCRASLRWPCCSFLAETDTAIGPTSTLRPKISNGESSCWRNPWPVSLRNSNYLQEFDQQNLNEEHRGQNGAPGARRGGELSTLWLRPKAGLYPTELRRLFFEQCGKPVSSLS